MRHLRSLLILALAPLVPAMAQEESPGADDNTVALQGDPNPDPTAYPRPMMMRPGWTSLDGQWDFAITKAGVPVPTAWQGKLSVPAAIESAESGTEKIPAPGQQFWYHRRFDRPAIEAGEIAVLHFGAVSSLATVWLNGTPVTAHRGANAAFSTDITAFLTEEVEQELVVAVTHPEIANRARPERTGITQTVWLEVLPQTYIRELRLSPNSKLGEITVFASIWGQANFRPLEIVALDGEKECARGSAYYHYENGGYETTMKIPEPKLWTPDSPKLYGMRIRLANEDGTTYDSITSYFALCDPSIVEDPSGQPRFALNGEPLLLLGVSIASGDLPRDDAGIQSQIASAKAMGFNCIRIRAGLASPRYYHWADRLGLLIWQDLPSPHAAEPHPMSVDAPGHPQLSQHVLAELAAIESQYGKHPSIVVWPRSLHRTEGKNTHPLTAAPAGSGDRADILFLDGHPRAAMPSPDGDTRPALAVAGIRHVSGQGGRAQYESSNRELQRLVRAGLSAAIFSDQPDPSLDPAWLAETNSKLSVGTTTRPHVLLPTGGEWKFSITSPSDGWHLQDFDDSGWQTGGAPFGDPSLKATTAWSSDRLWLRKSFSLASPKIEDLFLKIVNSGAARVYLNGTLVADCSGASSAVHLDPLPAEAATRLVDGKNTIAIEIESGDQANFLDAGLTEFRP